MLCLLAAEYKFAAFNTASHVYSYSSEEYLKHLRDDAWTREETDYLFDLCRTYDLRFILIHDRYDYPTDGATAPRTLEDLKDRYYSCCRKLVKERPAPDEQAKAYTANSLAFDKNREVQRKAYLRSLMHRTPAQIQEEEFLYVESRRLEQTYAKTTREREDLLRLLGGPGSGATIPGLMHIGSLPPGAVGIGGVGALMGAGAAGQRAAMGSSLSGSTNRRGRRGATVDEDASEAYASGSGKGGGLGKRTKIDPVYDMEHCITRLDTSTNPGTNAYGLPKSYNYLVGGPTVCVRSSRLPQIKSAMQPKIMGALTEMGINQRLIMPTVVNQDRLEALIGAVATLMEVKRQVDRAEYEKEVLKQRTVKSTVAPSEADADGEADDAPEADGDFAAPARVRHSPALILSS